VYFMVLEFIRCISNRAKYMLRFVSKTDSRDARHTGQYLAQKLHRCLEKYGLSKHVSSAIKHRIRQCSPTYQLFILMMDGARNCNTTARELAPINPHFKGTPWRSYCFLHIIQLLAKVTSIYLLFFIPVHWSIHNR
jgi:hypothetical protein